MTEQGKEDQARTPPTVMSASEFAHLGDGKVAYIKPLKSEEAERLFPTVKGVPEGIDLFALVGADGTPLALTDSRSSAIADALQNDLEPVSVH
jgi:hypothetical protein